VCSSKKYNHKEMYWEASPTTCIKTADKDYLVQKINHLSFSLNGYRLKTIVVTNFLQ